MTDEFDRPMTRSGADSLARRYGWQLVSVAPGLPGLEDRTMATFIPIDPADNRAFVADGRTEARALRRGLELCRLSANGGIGA